MEDFLAETGLDFKFIHLPVSHGLGILLTSARWQAQPELRQRVAAVTSKTTVTALQAALTDPVSESLLRWQARPYQLTLQSTLKKNLIPEPPSLPRPRLSIIVVLYNMRREAERTLYSLSARYQQEVNEADYEVIVVENGSTEPLENTNLSRFGPNFTYHFLPTESPSPVEAINFGAGLARGDFLGIMIDGAHILTPGVLKYAQLIFQIYRNPLGVVRISHLGHDAQPATLRQGYSRQVEDALLDRIDWPRAGYRLFEIGRLVYSDALGWFHPVSESNCLFVKREIFTELGGYDTNFKLPGGGVVNIDFYIRALETADAVPVVILGEASFHQTHGGVTSSPDPVELKGILKNFRAEYRAIRGKTLASFPATPLHFLGHMSSPASFELTKNHNRMLKELREKEREIRQLASVCAERKALINQLSAICAERETAIQQLASIHSGERLYRLLPSRLRQFLKRTGK